MAIAAFIRRIQRFVLLLGLVVTVFTSTTTQVKAVIQFEKRGKAPAAAVVCAPRKIKNKNKYQRLTGLNSSKQCRNKCKSQEGCKGYDFSKSTQQGKNKVCRLWKVPIRGKTISGKARRRTISASCYSKRKTTSKAMKQAKARRQQKISLQVDRSVCPKGHPKTKNGGCELKLNSFDKVVAQGYYTTSSTGTGNETPQTKLLRQDIEKAAMFITRKIIKQNTCIPGYGGSPWDCGKKGGRPPIMVKKRMPAGAENKKIDDYRTNTQEANVDEGDLIKSDGQYVYAGFGDYLAIWGIDGSTSITKIQMPDSNLKKDSWEKSWWKPIIRSLLLHDGRLLVVVDRYNNGCTMARINQRNKKAKAAASKNNGNRNLRIAYPGIGYDDESCAGGGKPDILDGHATTQLRIYDTADLVNTSIKEKKPISTRAINGHFQDLRSLGRYAHVMTTQNVDYYSWLEGPLRRSNFPKGITDEQYVAQASKVATTKTIPAFTSRLMKELKGDDTLPNLARISLFSNTANLSDANGNNNANDIDEVLNENGPISSLSLIHSLEMKNNEINTSTSGSFLPSEWSRFYLGDETVIIAGQGSSFNWIDRRSSTATYFVGFQTKDASTAPRSVGKVDGFIRDSYAMDVSGTELRIATTVRKTNWGWWWGGQQAEDDADESSTENYVTILNMNDAVGTANGVMTLKGRVKIGKKDEIITGVRFMDKVAYAVTFELTDPLYVIDLEGKDGPKAVGELEVTGFSNYLHPMNTEKTMILALGQEANKLGEVQGLKIAIFDATDPFNPKEVEDYVIEKDKDLYSDSDALDEYKAARYLMEANMLIIPVDVYDWDWQEKGDDRSFHGFKIYYTDPSLIEEKCSIEHEEEYDEYSLARRSMVFGGKLMTTFSKSVYSTNMTTCEIFWEKKISA